MLTHNTYHNEGRILRLTISVRAYSTWKSDNPMLHSKSANTQGRRVVWVHNSGTNIFDSTFYIAVIDLRMGSVYFATFIWWFMVSCHLYTSPHSPHTITDSASQISTLRWWAPYIGSVLAPLLCLCHRFKVYTHATDCQYFESLGVLGLPKDRT